MTETTEVVETPVEEPVETVVEVVETPELEHQDPVEVETAPEPDKEHGNKGKKPWYMKEIDDLRYQKAQERERAETLQAMVDRLGKEQLEAPPKVEPDID